MADALVEVTGQEQASGLPAWCRTAIEDRLAAKVGKVSPAALGAPAQAKTGGISGDES